MRKLLLGVGALAVLAVGLLALQVVAAESGEVVVLRTRDAAGALHSTRLWIVEDAGFAWLRAGSPESGWYARLLAQPQVEVVRGGSTLALRAEPVPDAGRVATTNRLMTEKYGWGEQLIRIFAPPRQGSVPVRLVPR